MPGLLIVVDKIVAVESGAEATCTCRIKNTGAIVDQFSLQVLGAPAAFTTSDPHSLSLFPGAEGEIALRITPPPTQRAGQLPLGIKLVSAVEPQATVVEEATLQVGAFVAVTVRIVPRVKKGRSVGKHTIVLRNTGNAATRVRISAGDPDDVIRFRGLGQAIPLTPGSPVRLKLRYRSTASHMTGPPESHPFTLSVIPESGDPVPVDGTFLQRAAISGWMITAFAGVVALIVLVLILRSLQDGSVKTQAQSAAALGQAPAGGAAATGAATSTSSKSGGSTQKPVGPAPSQPSTVSTKTGVLFVRTMPSASDSTGLFSADIEMLTPSGPVDLTNNPGQDFQSPSFSPDGQKVAFSAFAAGDHSARSLWIADNRLQNSTQRVVDCSNCTLLAWSYDGSLIAYVTSNTVVVVPANGTVQQGQAIANAPASITSIAWTRDSSHLAYTSGGQVLLVSRGGGAPKTLASGNVASGVTFSPDGRSIAYGLAPSGSFTQIVVGSIDPSFNVSSQHNVTNGGRNEFPVWTRDGKTILYAGTDANNFEIWSIPGGGGAPSQLTSGATSVDQGNVSNTEPVG